MMRYTNQSLLYSNSCLSLLITHADSRGWGIYFRFLLCVSVFAHDISKTDAARITKPDVKMFRLVLESTHIFWRQGTSNKNIVFALL